jgi:hypothetical protein
MANVLYAREFSVDVPSIVSAGHDLVVANRARDAIDMIKDKDFNFDAYLLGMVMVGDWCDVSEVEKLYEDKMDFSDQMSEMRKEFGELPVDYMLKYDSISTEYKRSLDVKAGEMVFNCLRQEEILGSVPILFWTSFAKDSPVCVSDKRDLVSVLDIPVSGEKLKAWFDGVSSYVDNK